MHSGWGVSILCGVCFLLICVDASVCFLAREEWLLDLELLQWGSGVGGFWGFLVVLHCTGDWAVTGFCLTCVPMFKTFMGFFGCSVGGLL
jgi:hypothetical protein